MQPKFPQFKALDIGDRDLLGRRLDMHASAACEYSFANLYIWKDFDRPQYTFVDGALCILIHPINEAPFFLEPISNGANGSAVRTCLSHTGRLSRVTSGFLSSHDVKKCSLQKLPDHFDYIYNVGDLAELKGRRYDGKRNRIRKFQKGHPGHEFIEISRGDKADAIAVFDEWNLTRRDDSNIEEFSMLAYSSQRMAIVRAFDAFADLNLSGGGIRIGNKLIGFFIGSSSNDLIFLHFLYAIPGFSGLYQTLLRDACRRTFYTQKYLNMEQDLGILGLRRMKESYFPLRVEEKFHIECPDHKLLDI